MTSAASLSLLKGGTKKALDDELTDAPATAAPAETDVGEKVEIETMNAKQIEALVKDNEIETPEGWSKLKLAEKKKWLNDQFGDDKEPQDGPLLGAETDTPVTSTEVAKPEPIAPAVEAAAEAKKTKAKGKAVTTAPKSGEVQSKGEDPISDMIHEIENLKQPDALAMVPLLAEQADLSWFRLGGVLSVIQANGWFTPFASFREFVENGQGLEYRKASYWVAIYNRMAETGIPWSKVKNIGWTKLKEIAPILTIENVDEWVAVAESNTTLQLTEIVRNFKKKEAGQLTDETTENIKDVTTRTFKLHADQRLTVEDALEKAKTDAGTSVDSAALEFICQEYMSGMTLAERIKKVGFEKALEMIADLFPGYDITVDEKAEA
jgi:hypothetical protein